MCSELFDPTHRYLQLEVLFVAQKWGKRDVVDVH